MSRVDIIRHLAGVPNTDKPVVMTGRMLHRIMRDIQSSMVQRVEGATVTFGPSGKSIFIPRSGGGSGSSGVIPFDLVTNGTTADDDENSTGTDDTAPKPKVKVLSGYVITTLAAGGDPTYNFIDETSYTLDGAAHTGFKAWLDFQSLVVSFGTSWPTEGAPTPWRFRYLHLATFDTSAEDSGPPFVASVVSNISQIWSGNVIPFFMPEHDHSRTGKGGNKIYLNDDSTDGGGAAPKFQVGNSNETNDYLFDYNDGTPKRGLKAKYKG